MRVVVITGAPGVGKTRLGHQLVTRYGVPAAAMDCDPVVHPWDGGEELYDLMAASLRAALPVYRAWGARVVVVTGVVLAGRAYERFHRVFGELGAEPVYYGLRADADALAARIEGDAGGRLFVEGRLAERHLDGEVPDVPGIRLVDTTRLTLLEATDAVAALERADLGPRWLGQTTT
ncbi:hypothetical protein [Streptomyces sp. DSM 15324]|uniref:hypothetical protein n=1 Tax=Streptomyces sp. DSM 15324 TaxID=1739111 RepID=UPI00074872B7|nr:hypothetical protein [Streptomyces sp. DSM 15324]KUO10107.1 hypothetical protein AQJ58_21920 [Streptomyces sp. DSM 15324]